MRPESAHMLTIAYCSGCRRYVEVSSAGECSKGHPRSALRDLREATIESAAVLTSKARRVADKVPAPELESLFAQVLGKSIIIVPVAAILAFGLWSGYAQFSGSGMSFVAKVGASVLSLAFTVGSAFLFFGSRRSH